MKFTDLLFRKYASPYFLLDIVVENCDFLEWTDEFIQSENDTQLWDVWLHKCIENKSFAEFKEQIISSQPNIITETQLKETVEDSKSILDNFKL